MKLCKLERENASSNAGMAAMCEVALIKGVKEKGRKRSIDEAIEKRYSEGLLDAAVLEKFPAEEFERKY